MSSSSTRALARRVTNPWSPSLQGNFLVLETKGKDTEQDRRKRESLGEWVNAVNARRLRALVVRCIFESGRY